MQASLETNQLCLRGAILVYGDILQVIRQAETKKAERDPILPRKHHWHRKAVHCVKWSQTGVYFISGGSETVLVQWQTESNKRDYLPHLGASIENITVSPKGTSYAVHLDDNSTMVLSTAEMKPTCYVSGLQSYAFGDRPRKQLDDRTSRWREGIARPLTATISPRDPSRLLLVVGNGHKAQSTGESPTALLQNFSLTPFQSASKQPLARTHPFDVNQTRNGKSIIEPTVTHLCASHDGRWMASVDEWQPPVEDYHDVEDTISSQHWTRERREIHLKFWEAAEADGSFELVSRINEAHMDKHVERILSIVADKRSSCFVTMGDDSIVRFWRPRVRQVDGITVTGDDGRPLVSWACVHSITLGGSIATVSPNMPIGRGSGPRRGALAFSDDGSALFAAFGDQEETVLYIIDNETGEVRSTARSLFRGNVRGIASVSSCVILLSDDLSVYDIVEGELQYRYQLEPKSDEGHMAQLVANSISGTFAVSVPLQSTHYSKLRKGATSEVAIFSLGDSQPLLLKRFPHVIISLLPAVGSRGFIAVDSAAQVWSFSEELEASPLTQPLAELNLDTGDEDQPPAVNGTVAVTLNGGDGSDVDEDENADEEMPDFDIHEAVIAPQHLAGIFDSGPAYAMPPIEDVFYQVVGLLSSKPTASAR